MYDKKKMIKQIDKAIQSLMELPPTSQSAGKMAMMADRCRFESKTWDKRWRKYDKLCGKVADLSSEIHMTLSMLRDIIDEKPKG